MTRQAMPVCPCTSTGRHTWKKGLRPGQVVCSACQLTATSVSSPICEQTHHDFRMTYSAGWYECVRLGCQAYAVCPGCLNCVIVDAVVKFCGKHGHLLPFLGDYPVRAYAPSAYASLAGGPLATKEVR